MADCTLKAELLAYWTIAGVQGHIYFGPRGYTINLWLCCGGWRCDADPRWK